MATIKENISHASERKAFGMLVDRLIKKISKKEDVNERSEVYIKIADSTVKFWGKEATHMDSINKVREAFKNPDNRWVKFLNQIIDETDPNCAKTLLVNLGYEGFLRGTKMIRENRKIYNCNICSL